VERCIADPGPPQTGTVPGLQRTVTLRFTLRRAGTRVRTNLRLWETIAGSVSLFPACSLQEPVQLERVSRQMREHQPSSLPGLTRQSIDLRKDFLQKRWMRGSSPRMTS
jgi:hypothetical protein